MEVLCNLESTDRRTSMIARLHILLFLQTVPTTNKNTTFRVSRMRKNRSRHVKLGLLPQSNKTLKLKSTGLEVCNSERQKTLEHRKPIQESLLCTNRSPFGGAHKSTNISGLKQKKTPPNDVTGPEPQIHISQYNQSYIHTCIYIHLYICMYNYM